MIDRDLIYTLGILAIVLVVAIGGAPLSAGSSTGPVDGDAHAILDIEQPTYIDTSVDIDRGENRTTYHVSGPEQRILLEGYDIDDVVEYGILEGSGDLSLDHDRQEYILDAQDEAGTRILYFDVEETVEIEDGNETIEETVIERHVAAVQIDRVSWQHLEGDQASDLRSDAENWSVVASQAERLAPGEDPEETISRSFTLYEFWDSPGQTFFADMQAAIIILTSRPGGLALLGLILGSVLIGTYGSLKTASKRERQFAEVEDLDEARRDAALQNARRVLSEVDWNAIFPEHHARSLRDLLGDDVWLGFKRYMLLRSPTSVKGTVLQAMGAAGYTAEIRRDEYGDPVDIVVKPPDSVQTDPSEGWERLELGGLDYDDPEDRLLIDLVPGSSLDLDVFASDAISLDDVRFPITNRDVDEEDLVDELDPRFPGDFEDEKQLAEVLEAMIGYVVAHDHTDESGVSRREMDILSFMAELDSLLCDSADFPVWHVERRILLYVAENMDPGEELQDRIDEMSRDGLDGAGVT